MTGSGRCSTPPTGSYAPTARPDWSASRSRSLGRRLRPTDRPRRPPGDGPREPPRRCSPGGRVGLPELRHPGLDLRLLGPRRRASSALATSARPGHSEHQLGLAIDFKTAGGAAAWRYADWARTREGAWLARNAWRYGFVMSYPAGKRSLTCYAYEPWHYRYVGRTSQGRSTTAAGRSARSSGRSSPPRSRRRRRPGRRSRRRPTPEPTPTEPDPTPTGADPDPDGGADADGVADADRAPTEARPRPRRPRRPRPWRPDRAVGRPVPRRARPRGRHRRSHPPSHPTPPVTVSHPPPSSCRPPLRRPLALSASASRTCDHRLAPAAGAFGVVAVGGQPVALFSRG